MEGLRSGRRGWWVTLGSILAALTLSGCFASEEQIQEAFDAHVADNDACETDADCAVIYPGCPLGCFRSVRADRADECAAYAESLISQFEAGGERCVYDCPTHSPPYCGDDARCQVDPVF